MNLRPHKVKIVASNASTYSMIAVCEYCGKVAFYGNRSDSTISNTLGECLNSPDYTSLLGSEIIGMIQRIGMTSFHADKE